MKSIRSTHTIVVKVFPNRGIVQYLLIKNCNYSSVFSICLNICPRCIYFLPSTQCPVSNVLQRDVDWLSWFPFPIFLPIVLLYSRDYKSKFSSFFSIMNGHPFATVLAGEGKNPGPRKAAREGKQNSSRNHLTTLLDIRNNKLIFVEVSLVGLLLSIATAFLMEERGSMNPKNL